ncbi:MAG: hypothetical protein GXO26_08300 [Crenarchaeota archaeon]|nr:hypothetical protein [Thermoproteota archaeon]
MSNLYSYILREYSGHGRDRPPTLPYEPRTPPGFLGLYGRYAYVHDIYPTIYQILGVNILHDHYSGRRVLRFRLGIIEVWAYHPETKDAIPLSVFGVPLSYVPQVMNRLREEGYRLMTIEQGLAYYTVPEEYVYNIEHVTEGMSDVVIIDPHGLMYKAGAVLPPHEQLNRLMETEEELHRLRLLLTNLSIQHRKVLGDYSVLRETVDRMSSLVETLYAELRNALSRLSSLESELHKLEEEIRLRSREALLYRTMYSYKELESMSLTGEMSTSLKELRTEISTLMDIVRTLREDVERIKGEVERTLTTPPSPHVGQGQAGTQAPAPARVPAASLFYRSGRYFNIDARREEEEGGK